MIKLIFEQDAEYIDDTSFPEKVCEVTIGEDDNLNTLFFELVQLARYAGYTITKNTWDSIKEHIDDRSGFLKIDDDEEHGIPFI